MTYSLLSIVHKIMAAVQPEGMVKQILDQVIVGNKLTPPSGPLKLDIGGITYQVSATENDGYFSARFMSEQTDAARRQLPSRDIETEKKRAIALAENILNIHWHASIGNKGVLNDILNVQRHASIGSKRVLNELPLKNINPDITGANGATPLIWAAANGHTEVVELLLQKGANINALDNDGRSPLINATGHTNVVKLLLQSGANVNVSDYYGHSPLIYAADYGYNTEVVELLLKKGANVNAIDNGGRSPLMKAVIRGYTEIVKLLLQSGANVNAIDNNGCFPLINAVINGDTEVVELLLKKGANVNISDNNGCSPLMKAIIFDCTDIVRLLLINGADVDNRYNGCSPLMKALILGRTDIVRLLLINGADVDNRYNGCSPLMKALILGRTDIVRLLLINGADVDTRDETGCTELILTASIVHTGIETAKIAEIAELLLRSGADVDAADNHGNTSLTTAAANGHSKIVELLLDYGADPNQSENTKSPLTCTIRELIKSNEDNRAGLIEAMELLLASGADITGKWEDEPNPKAGLTIKDKIVLLSNDYDINPKALNRPGSAQASRFPHCKTLKMQAERTVINAVKANKQNRPLPEALKALPLPDLMRERLLNK